MGVIFISYRRTDSATMTGRIYDRLCEHFGKSAVFKDVYNIPDGSNFREYISSVIRQCSVLLAIIGPNWIEPQTPLGQRRLDDPNDLVRIEIETALQQGKPVLPVLVVGAPMPLGASLPPSLRTIAAISAPSVRDDPDFEHDMVRLQTTLEHWLPTRKRRILSRRQLFVIGGSAIVAATAIVGVNAFARLPHGGSSLPLTGPTETPSLSGASLPPGFPSSLAQLGFAYKIYKGQAVILPPTATIPAGSFLMGSDSSRDADALIDEFPQSEVGIALSYNMSVYPVTVAEYALAVQAGAVPAPVNDTNAAYAPWQFQLQFLDHPVVNVSWFNARAYAAWLSELVGATWRLPTEAEWEKAARGTDGRIYPWGNQWDASRANTSESGLGTTTTVGFYSIHQDASPYGLHDMAGNVFTWCTTIYDQSRFPYPYVAGDGREQPNDETSQRVVRGGSWSRSHQEARAAARGYDDPTIRHEIVGFRLIRMG